mmetsp:Transcript_35642/g.53101  ORF Transcript_35642/g.53101 Transcript_35642/m.53101 type:complete len:200 (-) Transcript_35642:780-1379(-)
MKQGETCQPGMDHMFLFGCLGCCCCRNFGMIRGHGGCGFGTSCSRYFHRFARTHLIIRFFIRILVCIAVNEIVRRFVKWRSPSLDNNQSLHHFWCWQCSPKLVVVECAFVGNVQGVSQNLKQILFHDLLIGYRTMILKAQNEGIRIWIKVQKEFHRSNDVSKQDFRCHGMTMPYHRYRPSILIQFPIPNIQFQTPTTTI